MSMIKEAKILRKAIVTASQSLDDKTASTAAALFPRLKADGSLIKAGTRINRNGVIKRAAVDLWDTPENDPDNAPNLWEDIAYREGYRIIPDTITVGLAFAKDECGWWSGELYRSLIDANVHTPKEHPEGWERIGSTL